MANSPAPEGVTIVEATGYAGGNTRMIQPLLGLAMAGAVADCMTLGILDDTPNERLTEIVGLDTLTELFGERASEVTGTDYIRAMKDAARIGTLDEHRNLIKTHETMKATELHNSREA